MDVTILFLNGGFASTAIQPLEIFSAAGQLWNLLHTEPLKPRFTVTTASIDGRSVRVDSRVSLTPERAFARVEKPDLVFVPAGGVEFEQLALNGYDVDAVIEANRAVIPWLGNWANHGAEIAGACSGNALLAEAGLLDGKRGTSHWGVADSFRRRFPAVDWRDEYLVTDNGKVYCGGGLNAASDLSLYLVEKFCGREVAVQTARSLLIEMPRSWQSAFTHFSLRTSHRDEPILAAQEWLRQHFAEEVRFEHVARRFGMSGRNFARRFKEATGESPLAYLHELRIAVAKQMLERSSDSIQEVGQRVGYLDTLFFRNLFKRHTGSSPTEYRQRFGPSTVGAEAGAR